MADELPQVRASEPLTITILRARDLRGQRGDTVNALCKVEFGDKVLGETPKVDCSPEAPAEFNHHCNLTVTFEDPLTLDEIACKPVVVTVIEVLPKEKKQKEEKTVLLGQCTVDLLSMVQGASKQQVSLAVCPSPGSPIENLPPEHPRPEIDVQLTVAEPLLSEGQLQEANLACLTLETMYAVPEAWTVSGTQYTYTAALPLPIGAEKENLIVLTGGGLKPAGDKETANKQKKWAIPGTAEGSAVYIPDSQITGDPVEEEDGDLRTKEDREHRTLAESEKNRVLWNIERRCYLDYAATQSLQEKIAKSRYWPVEIYRTAVAAAGGKNKKEDEGHISFHGVAYVNLSPLLYPGVKRVRGAYKVVAYNEQELCEKAQRQGSVAEESMRIAAGILNRGASSPFPKGGKKDEGKGKDTKKGASSMKASDAESNSEGQVVVNVEGQQYTDAKSYIMLEFTLQRPLVPKRQLEELAQRVAEYIPPRPLYPKRTDGAERAVDDFHTQVGSVAALILDDFREQFGDQLAKGEMPNTPDAMEERRQQLIYHLNSTGKYFAFKEQLKHSVVKIVREKYLKTTNFKDKDQLQAFLSELYVYLVDQMHVGLNKVLAVEDQSPVPEPLTDSAQLKHFAREAEVNQDFTLAAKYYQERIARDRSDPDHWLDYGTFCLYINDLTKAEECFKECVAIDQRHLKGLLLYGVVCTMQDNHEAAETFFEAATSFDPENILAWTMLGLFYDGIGNEIGAEMALAEANKMNVNAASTLAKSIKEEEERQREAEREKERENEIRENLNETTELPLEEVPPINEAISKDGASAVGDSSLPPPQQQQPTPTSLTSSKLTPGAKADRKGSGIKRTGSRPGSLRPKSPGQQAGEEAPAEEAPPPREPTPVPAQTAFMQTVEFLLEVKAMPSNTFAERALAHHLLDPLGGPSVEYHISLARLQLQKHCLEPAETSLNDALQADHQNPDAWAILGHVKYMLGETELAKECYERTLSFVSDASEMHSIYLRLASIYLQEAKFDEAKRTFLMSCKRTPSCVSWLGVGVACFRLGELSESEDALSEANILNNANAEVWAYLSLVCLRTGRKLEAEQAYKYAIKLNLQDEDLLNEIHQVQEEVGFGNPQL